MDEKSESNARNRDVWKNGKLNFEKNGLLLNFDFPGFSSSFVRERTGYSKFFDVPEYLCHYTSLPGLMGILDKRAMFASCASMMNDLSEVLDGITMTIRSIKEQFGDLNCNERRVFSDLISRLEKVPVDRFYLMCFSGKRDDLYQFQAYAQNGVCIEFAPTTDCPIFMIFPEYSVERVIYNDLEKMRVINLFILIIRKFLLYCEIASAKSPKYWEYKYEESLNSIEYALIDACLKFKNEKFSYEQEYRIICNEETFAKITGLKFRVSNNCIIPYFELGWSIWEGRESKNLPIRRIVVSSVNYQKDVIVGIRKLMKSYDYSPDIVVPSSVPMRSR